VVERDPVLGAPARRSVRARRVMLRFLRDLCEQQAAQEVGLLGLGREVSTHPPSLSAAGERPTA